MAGLSCSYAIAAMPTTKVILSSFENPRGVFVGPAGGLFLTELFGQPLPE